MTARDAIASEEQAIHAYHDGELGWLARRRFERRLARSPELRRELEALAGLGELARRADAESEAPDLWADIAPRLPAIDREREESRAPSWGAGPLLRPLAATAAVAALGVAVVLGLGTGETGEASVGVVRWIDTGPHDVIVLEAEPADATIIWVLDAGREMSQGAGREVV
jgi:anti-sigma factor RsiW